MILYSVADDPNPPIADSENFEVQVLDSPNGPFLRFPPNRAVTHSIPPTAPYRDRCSVTYHTNCRWAQHDKLTVCRWLLAGVRNGKVALGFLHLISSTVLRVQGTWSPGGGLDARERRGEDDQTCLGNRCRTATWEAQRFRVKSS